MQKLGFGNISSFSNHEQRMDPNYNYLILSKKSPTKNIVRKNKDKTIDL